VTPEEKELQMVASLPLVQAIVAQSQRLSTPPQEEMQKLRASPSPEMNGSAEMHGGAVAPEPAGPLPPSKSVSRRSTAGGAGHEGDGTALVTIAGPEKKVLPVPPKLTPGVNTLEEIRAACRWAQLVQCIWWSYVVAATDSCLVDFHAQMAPHTDAYTKVSLFPCMQSLP
jgi:hypothetical protein